MLDAQDELHWSDEPVAVSLIKVSSEATELNVRSDILPVWVADVQLGACNPLCSQQLHNPVTFDPYAPLW